jgi:protein required for attachment to host cells
MHRYKKTGIIIADGGRVRVCTTEDWRSFRTEREMLSADLHLKSQDLVSDKPGRGHESAASARHAIEPKSDPHVRSKVEFLTAMASELDGMIRDEKFDSLLLVAPSRVAKVILEEMQPDARERVIGEIDKDLTKVPDHDLPPHFEGYPKYPL